MDDGLHRLVIRRAQMNAFRQAFPRRFEDNKVADLAARFPVRYRTLGESDVRALIRFAIRTGEKLGIRREQPVGIFIDVLFVELGARYEKIGEMPWALEVFMDSALPGDAKALMLAEQRDIEPGMREAIKEG